MKIGDRIRQARQRKVLTQSALAEAAGISLDYMNRIELGKATNLGLNVLFALGRALDISPATFLNDALEYEAKALSKGEQAEHDLQRKVTKLLGNPHLKATLELFSHATRARQEKVMKILSRLPKLGGSALTVLEQMVTGLAESEEKKGRGKKG